MPLSGSNAYPWPSEIKFYLDACLPTKIAQALRLVDYHIHNCDEFNMRDAKDEILIPWMGEQGFVWITRDDAARKTHAELLSRHKVSTIWVRGNDRQRKNLRMHDVHHMLTAKLMTIATSLANATNVLHHELYMNGGRPTATPILPDKLRRHGRVVARKQAGDSGAPRPS